MTRVLPITLLAAALLTSGCGEDDAAGLAADGTPRASYVVTVTADEGAPPRTWQLECEPAGGDHPDPPAACAAIAKAADPFGPVPGDMACTEIYGGPQVATIKGTRDGRSVDARYSRVNGCEIDRWDGLAAVLPSA